jgi:hypothetical protein
MLIYQPPIPGALLLVPCRINTDTVIKHFVIWTSLSLLSYCNGSQRIQYNKQAVAGTTRHIKFITPHTLEIIRKPGSATTHSVITAAYKIGLLTVCGIKKYNEKNYL